MRRSETLPMIIDGLFQYFELLTGKESNTYSQHDYKCVESLINTKSPQRGSCKVQATMSLAISSRATSRYSFAVLWFGA